jgi:hypothetical protein
MNLDKALMEEYITNITIQKAEEMIQTWSIEELKQYAFDRLVDELYQENAS